MTGRDVDDFAAQLRQRALDLDSRQILLSIIAGSDQEPDLSEPVVADGLGRIRHFHQHTSPGWPPNPLPILPAANALGLPHPPKEMRALVFQNAVCNWRCWYCFVPFNLLAAHPAHSRWTTCEALLAAHQALPAAVRPPVIDMSGGQPDLVPEWVIWMLDAVETAGLQRQVYLWSDDNLSNDYLFRYLSEDDIARLAAAPNYGRVGCLKGFDETSFAFNTGAPSPHYHRQFELLRRIYETGIDLYLYATFTTPTVPDDPHGAMSRFVDRLQSLDEQLPSRLVPLEITVFSPVAPRMRTTHHEALAHQRRMVDAWTRVLDERLPIAASAPGDVQS